MVIFLFIGIIDSGIGGYSFLKGINNKKDNYIIIMDKAYFPYGKKCKEFLIKRMIFLCDYLIKRGVDKIILGCNTLSIMVLDFLKLKYNNISGVIELLDLNYNDKTIFLGTSNSIKYIKSLYPNIKCLDCQDIINKIEKKEIIDFNYLNNLNYENIIMGCTHFIYYKKILSNKKFIYQDDLYKKRHQNDV